MDAIVNLVLATSVSAVLVYSWLPPETDETQPASIRDTIAVNATCVEIKCHGDFPVSSNRKYAKAHEAHHWS